MNKYLTLSQGGGQEVGSATTSCVFQAASLHTS